MVQIAISVLWAGSVGAALQVRKDSGKIFRNAGWIIASFGLLLGVLALAVHADVLKGA